MRIHVLSLALVACLGAGTPATCQIPGGDHSSETRRDPMEGRRRGRVEPPPFPGAASREGRMLREFVRLRLMLRRIRQQEAQIERGRAALADMEGKGEDGPVLTEREISLRGELLEIERGRFVEAARRVTKQAQTRITELQARGESGGEAGRAPMPGPRLEALKGACERISAPDSTFDSIAAELDALAESARSEVPDTELQQRLGRLEAEADSLRERLRMIEEEMMMIRGENPGDFWAPPPFGAGPGRGPEGEGMAPPREMRERGMFDGRTLPPNHPAMRRREEKPETPPPTP